MYNGVSYSEELNLALIGSFLLVDAFVVDASDLNGNCVAALKGIQSTDGTIYEVYIHSDITTNAFNSNAFSPDSQSFSLVCLGKCIVSYTGVLGKCQFCNITLTNCVRCTSTIVCKKCFSPFVLNTITHQCIPTNTKLTNCV